MTPVSSDGEPTVERGELSVFWICLIVVLAFWGDVYVMGHGGDLMGEGGSFPRDLYQPYTAFSAIPKPEGGGLDGKPIYTQNCAPCHQVTGIGVPGMNPPVAGSEWVTATGPNRLIRVLLDGLIGPVEVSGQQYGTVAMPPWRDTMTDEQIAAVLTFIRSEWGNAASEVTPEQVAAIRAETQGHAGRSYNAPELLGIPE